MGVGMLHCFWFYSEAFLHLLLNTTYCLLSSTEGCLQACISFWVIRRILYYTTLLSYIELPSVRYVLGLATFDLCKSASRQDALLQTISGLANDICLDLQ